MRARLPGAEGRAGRRGHRGATPVRDPPGDELPAEKVAQTFLFVVCFRPATRNGRATPAPRISPVLVRETLSS